MALSRTRIIQIKLQVLSALQRTPDLTLDEIQAQTQVARASLQKVMKTLQDHGDVRCYRIGRVVHYRLSQPEVAIDLETVKATAPIALGADLLGETMLRFFPHGFIQVFADFLSEAQIRISSNDVERFDIVAPMLLERLATLVNFFNTAAVHLKRRDLKGIDFFNDHNSLEQFLSLNINKGFHLGEDEKST